MSDPTDDDLLGRLAILQHHAVVLHHELASIGAQRAATDARTLFLKAQVTKNRIDMALVASRLGAA